MSEFSTRLRTYEGKNDGRAFMEGGGMEYPIVKIPFCHHMGMEQKQERYWRIKPFNF